MPPRRSSASGATAPRDGPEASNTDAGPSTSRSRALRNPAPRPPAKGKAKSARVITSHEMERIMFKLSHEGTMARRDDLVREREAELRIVMEEHDMAVKEKFHLERYVSILEGWDPAEARVDNSHVFLDVSQAGSQTRKASRC